MILFFRGLFLFLGLKISLFAPQRLWAQGLDPIQKKIQVGISENLGTQINLDEVIVDSDGQARKLATFFSTGRPVILSLVYYSCPGLCNLHLNGLFEGLRDLDWLPGEKYDFVALSFDPKDQTDLAQAKRRSYLKILKKNGVERGIHFATADQETVRRIANQVGFFYEWNSESKEWSHASAAILITPSGKIARYLHGVVFEPQTLKLALTEAGEGRVGNFVDQVVWYCFQYDPHQSKYKIYAFRVVQLAGGVMVLLLGLLLTPQWLRDRRRRRQN